jgi:hypothetical protein
MELLAQFFEPAGDAIAPKPTAIEIVVMSFLKKAVEEYKAKPADQPH